MNKTYNKSLLNEITKLDTDLREIYAEFGTDQIYLKKYITSSQVDIYGCTEDNSYSEPYQLIGRVLLKSDSEEQTSIGGKEDLGKYVFYIITSVLKEHGLDSITTDDIISYLGNDLAIYRVTPVNMLGDFALQYKIEAQGTESVPPHFNEL